MCKSASDGFCLKPCSEAYVVDVSTAAVVLQSGVSAADKARLKKHGAVSVNISMGALGAPSMKTPLALVNLECVICFVRQLPTLVYLRLLCMGLLAGSGISLHKLMKKEGGTYKMWGCLDRNLHSGASFQPLQATNQEDPVLPPPRGDEELHR